MKECHILVVTLVRFQCRNNLTQRENNEAKRALIKFQRQRQERERWRDELKAELQKEK